MDLPARYLEENNMIDYTVTNRAISPVVTLDEVRAHLNLFDDTSFDTLIGGMTDVAQQNIEDYLGEFLGQTDITQPYSGFWGTMPLVHQKITSIASITYKNTAGTTSTVPSSTYIFDNTANEKVITLKNGQAWPTDIDTTDYRYPVSINYEAQWTPLPLPITQALLLTISELFDNRGDSSPMNLRPVPVNVQYLLKPYVRR